MKWTEEQLRKIIIEETNALLDEPYDGVLSERSAAGGAAPTFRQKLSQAGQAAKGALDRFRASDLNQKGGEAILDLGKRVAIGVGKGLGKAAVGTAKVAGQAAGQAVGGALGGLARGTVDAFTGGRRRQRQPRLPQGQQQGQPQRQQQDQQQGQQQGQLPAPVMKNIKAAATAGLDKAAIQQLAKLYQAGILTEKEVRTVRLMERCAIVGKVKIVKENEEPIIIDV